MPKKKKDMQQVKVMPMPKGNPKSVISYDDRKMMNGNSAVSMPKPKHTK